MNMCRRSGGNPAGEGGIVVDVELEEMEKGIGDERDSAIKFCSRVRK